jgi:hypothetical protein
VVEGRGDGILLALTFALVGLGMGQAVQVNNGNLHPDAILWLTISIAVGSVGIALPRVRIIERFGDVPAAVLLGAGLAYQFTWLFTTPPAIYFQLDQEVTIEPYLVLLGVSAVIAGSALGARAWLGRVTVPVLIVVHFLAGQWLLEASPSPWIDVFIFQRDASLEFLAGRNPYAMTFPDIYGPGSSAVYGEGLSVDGRLTFGFPYPPLSLLLALPGQLLAGDYRYSQLTAMALAAGLLAFSRGSRLGAAAAAVFLFTPRTFFVLEQGWTEPFVVALLAAVVVSAVRFPKATPYLFGLFLASKQYLVFAVPLAVLLLPRPWSWKALRDFALRAAVAGLVVSLPLVLWDVGAFIKSVVTFQVHQPFRREALSFLAYFAKPGEPPLPTALGFLGASGMVALTLWRAPRTPAGFAASIALTYLVFFGFSKQAFCNYYYLVIGAALVAVAAVEAQSGALSNAREERSLDRTVRG